MLYPIASGLKFLKQYISMIPLDLDYAVLDRAAASAAFFQRTGQLLERRSGEGDSADNNDRATTTPLDLATQSHRAISGRLDLLCATGIVFFLFNAPGFA